MRRIFRIPQPFSHLLRFCDRKMMKGKLQIEIKRLAVWGKGVSKLIFITIKFKIQLGISVAKCLSEKG